MASIKEVSHHSMTKNRTTITITTKKFKGFYSVTWINCMLNRCKQGKIMPRWTQLMQRGYKKATRGKISWPTQLKLRVFMKSLSSKVSFSLSIWSNNPKVFIGNQWRIQLQMPVYISKLMIRRVWMGVPHSWVRVWCLKISTISGIRRENHRILRS